MIPELVEHAKQWAAVFKDSDPTASANLHGLQEEDLVRTAPERQRHRLQTCLALVRGKAVGAVNLRPMRTV